MPVSADHAVDEEALDDGWRPVGFVVSVGEGLVGGRVFAGEGDGGSIDAVFQGVEAGDGLALDGAGSRGTLRITRGYTSFAPIPFKITTRVA